MLLIDRLVQEIYVDEYFLLLYEKCILLSARYSLKSSSIVTLDDKEFNDILRFADILSNSQDEESRNKAYQIISSLNHLYYNNPIYKTISKAIFSKLGNFPAIAYLETKNKNNAKLPFLRELETISKKIIQKVPDSEDIFFTDAQFELFTKLTNNTEFSFSGPTSMGKSFLIKSFVKKVIRNSPPENMMIIVPTRALINQFSIDLKQELSEQLNNYRYKILINSNISDIITEEKFSYIFVLTPERFISYLSQEHSPPIGFLFVDEAHKLANNLDVRSITTYTAIEKAQKKYGNIKLYFSSPNVANPDIFLKLFERESEGRYFNTNESPVSQNLYFVDFISKKCELHTNNKIIDISNNINFNTFNNEIKFIQYIGADKNNLIYCNFKAKTIDKANEFASLISDYRLETEISKAIRNIKEYIHPDYYLADILKKGVAYHHGKLPQLIRNLVEELYKKEKIRNVFCTSTLLEGVNMPTQNIFILDNRNYRSSFEPIDFWNLSGRAGRLSKELEGNIFCIQNENNIWDNKEILKKEKVELNPTILTKVDRNLIKIEKILHNKDISGTETEKEILKYIANIIKVDSLEIESNYKSPIINKLIDKKKKKVIELAKSKTTDYEIPNFILNYNQTIDFDIQNDVFSRLKQIKDPRKLRLPNNNISYDLCLKVLNNLHELYLWEKAEKKLKNKNSLKYYAVLMNQWINGFTLNQIINQAIDWQYTNNHKIAVSYNEFVVFNKNDKKHTNILIEKIIEDIEHILRFLLEKYFNHYYQILVKLLGENNAGENWATLLEYGTQNRIIIALQNIGVSRNTAIKIYRNHKNSLTIIDSKLNAINKSQLLTEFKKESLEYDEIKKVL